MFTKVCNELGPWNFKLQTSKRTNPLNELTQNKKQTNKARERTEENE
jgi:hypothetical protein